LLSWSAPPGAGERFERKTRVSRLRSYPELSAASPQ